MYNRRTQDALFAVDRSVSPPSCLPVNMSDSSLIDITKIGDSWRVYLELGTGKVHDGAVYWSKMKESE